MPVVRSANGPNVPRVERPARTGDLRRFDQEEDNRLVGLYSRGATIKTLMHELKRQKSSIAHRLKVLKARGVVKDRGRVMRGKDLHVRMTFDMHARLSAAAAARGRTLSRHIRYILENSL